MLTTTVLYKASVTVDLTVSCWMWRCQRYICERNQALGDKTPARRPFARTLYVLQTSSRISPMYFHVLVNSSAQSVECSTRARGTRFETWRREDRVCWSCAHREMRWDCWGQASHNAAVARTGGWVVPCKCKPPVTLAEPAAAIVFDCSSLQC